MNKASAYDVIIIGSGSIGTPAALFLAQAGLKPLVIDNAASVGQGSNKKAIGGVRATHSDPAKIALCLRSIEIFTNWQDTYGDDIEWVTGGYSFVAYREKEEQTLKNLLKVQQSFGLDIHWLDKKDIQTLLPGVNPVDLIGGTYSPGDGNASPLLALHAMYRQAVHAGAVFQFNEIVNRFITEGDAIRGVTTNMGSYHTPVVVNAAGAHARPLSQLVHLDIPVNPDAHEAAITEPVSIFFKPMLVDIRPYPGSANFYFYQHITGQILFCITPSPNIWGDFTQETSEFLPMACRRLIDLMPKLAGIRVRRAWRGLYPMTPDGFPIIGWDRELHGYLYAVGMCGQGFMLGPGVGELLVRIITNKTTEKDQEILSYLSPYREFSGQEKLK
ncbi:MAG: FAD-binding oxidoreductase [Anaerolineaceae bacterium]|nr:FAD-binding oxidoreductase [Anaerolineaceae bacterium]